MTIIKNFQLLADFNAWANTMIFSSCKKIGILHSKALELDNTHGEKKVVALTTINILLKIFILPPKKI